MDPWCCLVVSVPGVGTVGAAVLQAGSGGLFVAWEQAVSRGVRGSPASL